MFATAFVLWTKKRGEAFRPPKDLSSLLRATGVTHVLPGLRFTIGRWSDQYSSRATARRRARCTKRRRGRRSRWGRVRRALRRRGLRTLRRRELRKRASIGPGTPRARSRRPLALPNMRCFPRSAQSGRSRSESRALFRPHSALTGARRRFATGERQSGQEGHQRVSGKVVRPPPVQPPCCAWSAIPCACAWPPSPAGLLPPAHGEEP